VKGGNMKKVPLTIRLPMQLKKEVEALWNLKK